MTAQSKQLLEAALELPPAERAELADQILASFNGPSQKEIDAAWAAEAEKRIDARERGETKPIPADEVFARTKDRQR